MTTSTSIRRGLGIIASLDAGLARDLAVAGEQLGYHSLWSNDEPAAAGLQNSHRSPPRPPNSGSASAGGPRPHQPTRIAADIDRLGLDPARLWIGIGSGQLCSPTDIVNRAVAELRQLLPDETRIVVAAMRPRPRRLGGAIADGVLLNWMLPTQASQARRRAQEGADEAGRKAPVVAAYIRVAVGPGSRRRLRHEEDHYRNINDGHRTHFEAMNAPPGSVGVAASTRSDVLAGLAPYDAALDLPIARGHSKRCDLTARCRGSLRRPDTRAVSMVATMYERLVARIGRNHHPHPGINGEYRSHAAH